MKRLLIEVAQCPRPAPRRQRERNVSTRREILRNAGFTVLTPRNVCSMRVRS
jgi:hypothetical protein